MLPDDEIIALWNYAAFLGVMIPAVKREHPISHSGHDQRGDDLRQNSPITEFEKVSIMYISKRI